MNLLRTLTRPVHDLVTAATTPFKALFVVGLCAAANWITFSGVWWVEWVALGMGIATAVALARGLRAQPVLALLAWVGWKIQQRRGDAARRRFDRSFDDWATGTPPKAAQVLVLLRSPARRAEVFGTPAG